MLEKKKYIKKSHYWGSGGASFKVLLGFLPLGARKLSG